MILATLASLATLGAWALERRARRRAETDLGNQKLANGQLRHTNERLRRDLQAEQIALEVLEEREDFEVVNHLERTVSVTDFNGLPVYRWELTSPYPTLAEAVRHVPKSR